MNDQKTYQTLEAEKVFHCRVFDVRRETVTLPNQARSERFIIEHPGAVVILPRAPSGELVLVEQYRHAVGKMFLEFPAGTLENAEPPLDCAKREIREETGFAAASWTELGPLYPAPGFCNELQHLFFADGLTHSPLEGDEDEIIEVVHMSVSEVEDAIGKGTFCDAKSIAAFMRARLAGLV